MLIYSNHRLQFGNYEKKETELHTATKILAYLLHHPIKILEKYANRMSSIRISQCCNSHIAGLLFVIFSSAIRMCFSPIQNVPWGRYLKILYRYSAKTRGNDLVAVSKYIKHKHSGRILILFCAYKCFNNYTFIHNNHN